MENKEFVSGLFVYKPSERAPEFIKANLSVNKASFTEWLNKQQDDWVKIDILESRDKSKWYASLNTYKKPEQTGNTIYQPNHNTPIPPYKEKATEQVDWNSIPF